MFLLCDIFVWIARMLYLFGSVQYEILYVRFPQTTFGLRACHCIKINVAQCCIILHYETLQFMALSSIYTCRGKDDKDICAYKPHYFSWM